MPEKFFDENLKQAYKKCRSELLTEDPCTLDVLSKFKKDLDSNADMLVNPDEPRGGLHAIYSAMNKVDIKKVENVFEKLLKLLKTIPDISENIESTKVASCFRKRPDGTIITSRVDLYFCIYNQGVNPLRQELERLIADENALLQKSGVSHGGDQAPFSEGDVMPPQAEAKH